MGQQTERAELGRVRDGMRPLTGLDDLAACVTDDGVYLRISGGPLADRERVSMDYESGMELPGLSVVPLAPPAWWKRPAQDWIARQVCKYIHLHDESDDPRYGWLLRGRMQGRGPDNEPLVDDVEPIAWLPEPLLEEAKQRYADHFDVGEDST